MGVYECGGTYKWEGRYMEHVGTQKVVCDHGLDTTNGVTSICGEIFVIR